MANYQIIFQLCLYLVVIILPVTYGQRWTTTTTERTTTSSYDSVWSSTTSRSSTLRPTATSSYDGVLLLNSERGSTRRPVATTRRPPFSSEPSDTFGNGHRQEPSTRRPWPQEMTTSGWTGNRRTQVSTRKPPYSPTVNDRFIEPPPTAPSVNFTVGDSKSNTFNAAWNSSTNKAELNIKNFRDLKLTFICNASYPIEWLSQSAFNGSDKWEMDEFRHFQVIPSMSTLATSWSSQHQPQPKQRSIVIYTAVLSLTFEKSESVPKYLELNCARARRDLSRGWGILRKQTVIQISKDFNVTLHAQVFKDVQSWPKGNFAGSLQQLQYREPLGTNLDCVVRLEWTTTAYGSRMFVCTSEGHSNLTIDYVDKSCYDHASCERIYSENTNDCSDIWRNPKLIEKSTGDLWNKISPPTAGIVYCKRDQDIGGNFDQRADALPFFHSLPPNCPEDDASTRLQLHIASIPIEKDALARDFISFCSTPKTYDDLKEDRSPLVVYAGENVTVTCIGSWYHFASGSRIKLLHSTNQEEYAIITDSFMDRKRNQGCFNFTAKVHIKSATVTALICENYLKQSSEFVQKTLPLIVRVPRNITFVGGITQLASWNYTGQRGFQLKCEADGDPQPKITWKKQGRPIPDIIEQVDVGPSVSILKFPVLQESRRNSISVSELHGTYTCEAGNRLDTNSRTFHVESAATPGIPVVIDTSNSAASSDSSSGDSLWILWIILPIFALVVVAVIAYLVWKIKMQSKELRLLSKAEVDEFLFGKPEFLQHHSSSEEVNNYAPFLPYNRGYEVSKDQLIIEENAVLGSGAYAIVLRGALIRKDGERVCVAIKTARTMDDISLFKALLSELKIMGFIGTHPNIVNLMGAHTKNIMNREIFIAIEFCANGNLLTCLRDHRNRIKNLVDQNGDYDFIEGGTDSVSRQSFFTPGSGLNTVTLIKWSYEIANGMEFLSQKKVIHGDLAARNILLNEHLIAKIGDFGLSRQLFEYANYIKKQQSPLPWKWLAIECLQDMRFSIKSDVWAYSILLFEIFSLGQVPYPGYSYNDEFLEALINGKRPNRPAHATKDIYLFMQTCWKDNSEVRPNFTQIREFFSKLLFTLVPQEYIDLIEKVTTTAEVPDPTSSNSDGIAQGSLPQSCSSNRLVVGSKSSGGEQKPGRFSFNMNPKTITAMFHRN